MQSILLGLDTRINNYASIDLMQGYNYTLEAHITDNYKDMDLTGVTVQLQMQKPDKKFIIQTENIIIEGNKIKAILDKDFTREDGQAKLQVVLLKDNFTFGSWVVKAKIKPSAINDNDGQSENKVTITEGLINKINEAENTKIELDKSIANGDVATIKGNVDKIKDVEIPKINEQLDNKADNTTTENIQQQVNNLVLGAVGDGNNAEVIQARGGFKTLNDRVSNVEVVKSYNDVTPITDVSYGLDKVNSFTMTGFNGTDLVTIPVENFDKADTKYTIIMKFTNDIYCRCALKIYDNTWGSGKLIKDLGAMQAGTTRYITVEFDVSGYDKFAKISLSQVSNDYGVNINLQYIKIIKSSQLSTVDDFDLLYSSYGDSSTYILPSLKVLPSNIIELLSQKSIPSNIKSYVDTKTEGSEALKIFDTKTIKNNIYNYEIPNQIITNEGNGTKIVQIPTSDLSNLSEEITLIIKYKLNDKSTAKTYAMRIFDENWGTGITIDLGSNNISNKEYFVTYTFNKNQFKNWVLFRFSRIGIDGEVILDIDYVKLFNKEDFLGIEDLDSLHNNLGNLEIYPLVNFKIIPNNLEKMLEKENKNIVMIGDSIANQFAGVICENNGNSEYSFINKCIGGETTLDTMARLGAIPYLILPPFTIPSDTSNSEEVNIVSSLFLDVEFDGTTAKASWKNGYLSNYSATPEGINPYSSLKCEISGVKGTLYFKRSTGVPHYFKRDVAGNQVIIDRPTEVIPVDSSSYDKDAVYTCFMGTNEGWCNRYFEKDRTQMKAGKTDAELLFSYYKRIAQHINTNKFLFMGFYMCAFLDQTTPNNRIEWWEYFEELMSKEFGNKYFSVRKYLREIGYKDASVQLIQQDLQDIKDGKIPIVASTGDINGVHVTNRISACVGNEILKRLKGLDYIHSYNKIDVMQYDNGQTSTNPDDFLPPQ